MVIDSWVPAIAVIDETVKWKGGRIMRDNKRGGSQMDIGCQPGVGCGGT